jgi:hypothetical protein
MVVASMLMTLAISPTWSMPVSMLAERLPALADEPSYNPRTAELDARARSSELLRLWQ